MQLTYKQIKGRLNHNSTYFNGDIEFVLINSEHYTPRHNMALLHMYWLILL